MNHLQPNFNSVTYDWLQTPGGVEKLILSPQKKLLGWMEFAGPLDPSLKQDKVIVGRAGMLMSWFRLSERVSGVIKAFKALNIKDPILKTIQKGVVASSRLAKLTKMGALGARFLHEEGVILLSKTQLVAVRAIGFVATFFSVLKNCIDIKNIIYRLRDYHSGDPGLRLELMNLVGKICSLITALFTMGVFVFGGKGLVLVVATVSLCLAISKYYYKNIYIINCK